MTLAIATDRRSTLLVAILALTLLLVVCARPAIAANAVEEARPMSDGPKAVEDEPRSERVVVAPEPPHWSGWDDYYRDHPWPNRTAPRIRMWIDRGEWSTYRPGDRLWVYFRVDRPCYVTILDYSPDGRVSTIYPSRWSGSTFVSPGRTYRIPESRSYSLRIAGAGGVETLVACAHESPWPSGPGGAWIPRHHPNGGRVVVGRPGGSPPPGWRGRVSVAPFSVMVGPGHWPVPPEWNDYPERWSCDSVSFYVDASYDDGRWYYKDGQWWNDGDPNDDWYYRDNSSRSDSWDRWDGRDYGRDYGRDEPGRTLVRDAFRMEKCSDAYSVGFDAGRVVGEIEIECVASSKGDPTEIVGRIKMRDHWGDDELFRLDVAGEPGERPEYGRVYTRQWGDVVVQVAVTGFGLSPTRQWQTPRIEWIEFDVRVLGTQ